MLRGFLYSGKRPSNWTVLSDLTNRERQILQLLAGGKSTREVSLILEISIKTAESHRGNVMRKLGLHSVSELVLYAIRNNFVQVSGGNLPAQITGSG